MALAACATTPGGVTPAGFTPASKDRARVEKALTQCAVAALTHLNLDQADIAYRVASSAQLTVEPAALRESMERCAAELDVHAAPSVSGRIEIRSSQKGNRQ